MAVYYRKLTNLNQLDDMDEARRHRLDTLLRQVSPIEAERLAGTHASRLPLTPFDETREAYCFDLFYKKRQSSIYVNRHNRFSTTPPHFHNHIELNVMYSGSLRQIIDGQEVVLSPSVVALVDSNTVHSIDIAGEGDILLNIDIDKGYLTNKLISALPSGSLLTTFFVNALNSSRQVNYLVFNVGEGGRLHSILDELIYEAFFPSAMHTAFLDQLFWLAIMDMFECVDVGVAYSRLSGSNTIVADALSLIDMHYRECTLEGVAGEVGVSAPYLTTLLKRNVGKSFMQLVISKRMAYAYERLLATDVPVEQVARESGYENLSFFYRKFREAYGCNPRELRRRPI